MRFKYFAGLWAAAAFCATIGAAAQAVAQTSPNFKQMRQDIQVDIRNINGQTTTETMTLREAMDFHRIEGAVIVTIVGGKIEKVARFGYRNIDDRLPVDRDTIFPTASMSKLPAALAMVAAARLGTGPKLGRVVGKIADANYGTLLQHWYDTRPKTFWSQATGVPNGPSIRRLLSHTAGLSRHGVSTAITTCATGMRNVLLGNDACGEEATNPIFIPGTAFDYSGGGFTVAEAALEAVSGRSAESFLQEYVLDAFGMSRSTYARANPAMTNLARPCYDRGTFPCSAYVLFTDVKFAGGLIAHPVDYAKMINLILNDGKDRNGIQVIPMDDIEEILTPIWHSNSSLKACTSSCSSGGICLNGQCRIPLTWDGQRYGLGVMVEDDILTDGLPREFHHGGGQPGVATRFWADRKTRNAIVVMSIGEPEFTTADHLLGVSDSLPGAKAFVWDIISAWKRAY